MISRLSAGLSQILSSQAEASFQVNTEWLQFLHQICPPFTRCPTSVTPLSFLLCTTVTAAIPHPYFVGLEESMQAYSPPGFSSELACLCSCIPSCYKSPFEVLFVRTFSPTFDGGFLEASPLFLPSLMLYYRDTSLFFLTSALTL